MSHLCMGPWKTMIRRQFRCTLDGYRYGRYDEVPLNIPCFERENEPGQFIREKLHLGCALSTKNCNQIDTVPLLRGTTLKALHSAHLLFACDSEERGNYTLERSESGVPPGGHISRLLRYSFPCFSKTFWRHNTACLGMGHTLAVR
jgi:hypothetical protein